MIDYSIEYSNICKYEQTFGCSINLDLIFMITTMFHLELYLLCVYWLAINKCHKIIHAIQSAGANGDIRRAATCLPLEK